MFDRPAIVYQYDGTLEGLLSSIFLVYRDRTEPVDIQTEDAPQEWLYPTQQVTSDPGHASRVDNGVGKKMSQEARQWLRDAFLYGEEGKEMAIYHFIRFGLERGAAALRMFGHPAVAPVYKMIQSVSNEVHLYLGFVRFADLGGVLAAEIAPKHFVLPKMVEHFTDRYPEEQFIIHDKIHHAVLAYRPYESRLFFAPELILPQAGEEDRRFQALWQGYFQSAAISARANPLCQRTHCPKRFWSCMNELAAANISLGSSSPKVLVSQQKAEEKRRLLIDKPGAGA